MKLEIKSTKNELVLYILIDSMLHYIIMVVNGFEKILMHEYHSTWSKSSHHKPGGSDCFNLSAFSESKTQSVYRYLEQRTLNFTTSLLLFIFTERASFLLAVRRKSLISCICFGYDQDGKQLVTSTRKKHWQLKFYCKSRYYCKIMN